MVQDGELVRLEEGNIRSVWGILYRIRCWVKYT